MLRWRIWEGVSARAAPVSLDSIVPQSDSVYPDDMTHSTGLLKHLCFAAFPAILSALSSLVQVNP